LRSNVLKRDNLQHALISLQQNRISHASGFGIPTNVTFFLLNQELWFIFLALSQRLLRVTSARPAVTRTSKVLHKSFYGWFYDRRFLHFLFADWSESGFPEEGAPEGKSSCILVHLVQSNIETESVGCLLACQHQSRSWLIKERKTSRPFHGEPVDSFWLESVWNK
jgi:hypothetical protein